MSDGALAALQRLRAWMHGHGWTPLPYQERVWEMHLDGGHGLIVAPTGSGKTYAATLGPLAQLLAEPTDELALLYLTPLRALTRNIADAIARPVFELDLPIRVESRTGDTGSSVKKRQRQRPPNVLVTTPESLSILLSYYGARTRFAHLRAVVVDEWHSLLESKRGTLLELSLSALRGFSPDARVWGLSATIGNPDQALDRLIGVDASGTIVRSSVERATTVVGVVPQRVETLPWVGHLGLPQLDRVLEQVCIDTKTLIFTNTRSQAERWFEAIAASRPEWFEWLGLHHGSIDPDERLRVESGLRHGDVRIAVCTSSLDLGLDIGGVDTVIQVGSPRSMSRLLQRAGRASHRPGEPCRIVCVPTYGPELVDVAVLREAAPEGRVEPITPADEPLDVLIQHIVTRGIGDGFTADGLYDEVRSAVAYRNLTRDTFDTALDFASHGGPLLEHYPHFERLVVDEKGKFRAASREVARLHRMNIGTIAADGAIEVRYLNGKRLGTVEEFFIANLTAGDVFIFQGRSLELVHVDRMAAYVKRSTRRTAVAPRWAGGRLPMSRFLGDAVRKRWSTPVETLIDADGRDPLDVHIDALIVRQATVSAPPDGDRLLVESLRTRDGFHLFFYPFEGTVTNEMFGTIVAARLSRDVPMTIAVSANEYGVELHCDRCFPIPDLLEMRHLSPEGVENDIEEASNLAELAKRRFRSVARVSGLVLQNYPGRRKGARQLQATSGLIYDVFRRHDPDNLLLRQARREVLEQWYDVARLHRALARAHAHGMVRAELEVPSPLAFPLMIGRVKSRVSNETLADRIARMRAQWLEIESKSR